MSEYIKINPSNELVFEYCPNKKLYSKLSVKNVDTKKIIYKIKSNNMKLYDVSAPVAVLSPQDELQVDILMNPISLEKAKTLTTDQFQIEAFPVLQEQTNQDPRDLWKSIEPTAKANKTIQKLLAIVKVQINQQLLNFSNSKGPLEQSENSFAHNQFQSVFQSEEINYSQKNQELDSRLQEKEDELKKTQGQLQSEKDKQKELQKQLAKLKQQQEKNQQSNDEIKFSFLQVIVIAVISLIIGSMFFK